MKPLLLIGLLASLAGCTSPMGSRQPLDPATAAILIQSMQANQRMHQPYQMVAPSPAPAPRQTVCNTTRIGQTLQTTCY